MPKVVLEKCDYCGKCARACPMAAVSIDTKNKARSFQTTRCVGCGQCLVACDKKHAIVLEPVPDYVPPIVIGKQG
jgi:MinD superfamily P-loop ATPase